MHQDDDGRDCDCQERECGYDKDREPTCPDCGAGVDDLSLVCGDHGYRCDKCAATFTCP